MKWLKNNWWKLLIIPVVALFLYRFFQFVVRVVLRTPQGPDLLPIEKKEQKELEKLARQEQDRIDKAKQENDNTKKCIERGEITPSEIFNKEIRK